MDELVLVAGGSEPDPNRHDVTWVRLPWSEFQVRGRVVLAVRVA